jgi:hypothetical protein
LTRGISVGGKSGKIQRFPREAPRKYRDTQANLLLRISVGAPRKYRETPVNPILRISEGGKSGKIPKIPRNRRGLLRKYRETPGDCGNTQDAFFLFLYAELRSAKTNKHTCCAVNVDGDHGGSFYRLVSGGNKEPPSSTHQILLLSLKCIKTMTWAAVFPKIQIDVFTV